MDNKKIVWLASYPKSGNTWFRAFITALLNDGGVDINEMKTDGIFSSRQLFDLCTDMESTYLYDEEIKLMQPSVFKYIAGQCKKDQLFIKIHDAFKNNVSGVPIIPVDDSLCAIYIIRQPLDVVVSLANHINSTIDDAIALMNNKQGCLARQKHNLNITNQFRQWMGDWSDHVQSWVMQKDIPVLVIRYEDMLINPVQTFTSAVEFMKLNASSAQIEAAIEEVSFDNLKKKEHNSGFREKSAKDTIFFRKGRAGNWQQELTSEQVESIVNNHKIIMEQWGYLVSPSQHKCA